MNKYFRFIFGLEDFLKNVLTSESCIQSIKERINNREDNFLRAVKECIYHYPSSPYLKLLNLAKISYKNIESFVKRDGLEGALHILKNEGVYLTLEEARGKNEVVRKGHILRFKESDFNNPRIPPAFYIRTGGTTNKGTGAVVNLTFEFLAERAAHRYLMFEMHSLFSIPFIIWYPTLGGVELATLLECAKIGKVPAHFFYQLDKRLRKPSLDARMAFWYLDFMGKKMGINFPKPKPLILGDISEIARLISNLSENNCGSCIRTFVSSAVKICDLARQNNFNIEGTKFWVSGEPLTRHKFEEIASKGAKSICQYSFAEMGGTVAIGCDRALSPDDTHFLKDLFAVIQHNKEIEHLGTTFNAFLFTSLSLYAPKIFLNVENGDYGVVEERDCSCQFGKLGLNTHIYNIRSFEKFNAEGMTIFGSDLLKLIEETLVPKYGGSSIDYQFIEEQDSDRTRTTLIVSPDVGKIDGKDMLDTIYKELSISPAYQTQLSIWRQADTLRIKRAQPIPNKRGKIYSVRVESNV